MVLCEQPTEFGEFVGRLVEARQDRVSLGRLERDRLQLAVDALRDRRGAECVGRTVGEEGGDEITRVRGGDRAAIEVEHRSRVASCYR